MIQYTPFKFWTIILALYELVDKPILYKVFRSYYLFSHMFNYTLESIFEVWTMVYIFSRSYNLVNWKDKGNTTKYNK